MFKNFKEAKEFCAINEVKFIDFKLIDLQGRWHHLTITESRFTEDIIERGIGFDGSSYGFLTVEKSDMVFKPDLSTAFIDPFIEMKTLVVLANIYTIDGKTERFGGDPRYIAKKAEEYMKKTGIADKSLFGPEFEFYILDHISYQNSVNNIEVHLDSEQAEWNSKGEFGKNLGFKVEYEGGYHVDIPKDINYDLRNKMVYELEKHDIPVKYHHPEVGGPGQLEIELSFATLLEMADRTMKLKYILKNTAIDNGKTITFMPKPFYKEAGNGMHVHFHMFKDNKPLFYNEGGYADFSEIGLYAIGGILKHSKALLAITNPSTNSYKRLVPGYEAPVSICFGMSNRSSVIRIPGYAKQPDKKRFEFRPSDATCNPYLAYAALLMAALDGIENKINPTDEGFGPFDVNIFNLPQEEKLKIKALPKSLAEAADSLEKDYEFLLKGNVFTEGLIKDQIERIRKDFEEVSIIPHPKEYEKYYDL